MERDGWRYVRQDNCFPWVEDPQRAQRLLNQQLEVNWSERLQPIAERPLHGEIFRNFEAQYYWSSFQCEWATDVLLQPGTLEWLEPLMLRHGLLHFSPPDILRFFGRRIRLGGTVERFSEEITTSLKVRIL